MFDVFFLSLYACFSYTVKFVCVHVMYKTNEREIKKRDVVLNNEQFLCAIFARIKKNSFHAELLIIFGCIFNQFFFLKNDALVFRFGFFLCSESYIHLKKKRQINIRFVLITRKRNTSASFLRRKKKLIEYKTENN